MMIAAAFSRPYTIMVRTLHSLTMLMVLGHMVLGCCLHHARADSCQASEGIGGCRHEGHGHSPADRSDCVRCRAREGGPCNQSCHGAHCTFFVRPERSASKDLDAPSPPWPAVIPAAVDWFGEGQGARAPRPQALAQFSPLRLHFLDQALLI
jgi:hypothetical protein